MTERPTDRTDAPTARRLSGEQLGRLLAPQAVTAAKAWTLPLQELRAHWTPTSPDWERVFPGLIALLGIQSLLWPAWTAACGQTERVLYSRPAGAGKASDALWRFDYQPVASQVAWSLVGGPGLTDWAPTRSILTHRDVRVTLASLDAAGKVIVTNSGGRLLAPLVGGMISGEARLDLPLVECEAVQAQVSDWRASVAAITEPLQSAATVLAAVCAADRIDIADALNDSFACLAWNLWATLAEELQLATSAGSTTGGLRALFSKRGPDPYKGILLLHGDHYALWQELCATRIA